MYSFELFNVLSYCMKHYFTDKPFASERRNPILKSAVLIRICISPRFSKWLNCTKYVCLPAHHRNTIVLGMRYQESGILDLVDITFYLSLG